MTPAADRAWPVAQFPAPLTARCRPACGIVSPSWGSPLALKALGEIEDEAVQAERGLGRSPRVFLSPPEGLGKGRGGASPGSGAEPRVSLGAGQPRWAVCPAPHSEPRRSDLGAHGVVGPPLRGGRRDHQFPAQLGILLSTRATRSSATVTPRSEATHITPSSTSSPVVGFPGEEGGTHRTWHGRTISGPPPHLREPFLADYGLIAPSRCPPPPATVPTRPPNSYSSVVEATATDRPRRRN